MVVLMVPICVGMFVAMHPRLVAVFVPVMGVGAGLVTVFMLMLFFAVAAHAVSPPFPFSVFPYFRISVRSLNIF